MSRLSFAVALVGLFGLATCIKTTTTTPPDGDGASTGPATVPGGAVDPGQADPNASPPPTAGGCLSNADCDGGVCEGMGCGDDQSGTCAPAGRMCTRDSAPYCGCDGNTFRSSGSCPGRRYAAKGECDSPAPGGGAVADGSPCTTAGECSSGICEGEGCGDDQPGTCAPAKRMCTRDYRAYCGCDGNTFRASGSCPGQRYASRGECGSASAKGGA